MKKLNKKGFTLVEIIVVIAIIGVLASILVPTLIGYTTKANVISANSTAASLKKSINNFLVSADANNYGMRIANTSVTDAEIIISGGVWTVNITDPSHFSGNAQHIWTGSGSGQSGAPISAAASAEAELAITLANLFPELETGYIKFNLKAGDCNALYFTDETDVPFTIQPFATGGWVSSTYAWNNSDAGISVEGYVVGTAPVLELA